MSPWFPYGRPNPAAAIRLFCFPYAGGGASIFRPWWLRSSDKVDVVPVQFPGRENRISEPSESDLRRLVAKATDALRQYTAAPYALFGHSMGATVAYELAHDLMEITGEAPAMLLVSGCPAPHLLRGNDVTYGLSREQVVAKLRQLNGTPQIVLEDESMIDLILPRLRADWIAVDTYRYAARPRLPVPISVFGGTKDPDVSVDELLAWKSHALSSIRTRLLPGDHFFVDAHREVMCDLALSDLTDRNAT